MRLNLGIAVFLMSVAFIAGCDEVALKLDNPGKGEFKGYPLTLSVPFPKGKLKDASTLKLKDSSGNEIPYQMQELCTWPQDKSIQWLMFDFLCDLKGKKAEELKLELADGSPEEVKDGIIVKESPKGFEINTGAAVFTVSKEKFNLFDTVSVNNKNVLSADDKNHSLYLKDKDGKLFASSLGAPDEVKLELKGPVRSVIKADGWFYSGTGEKMCRYTVRLNFFKGKPFVKMLYTFLITENTEKAKFSDIGISLPLKTENVLFGGTDKRIALKDGSSEYLLQYDNDKLLLSDAKNPGKWKAEGDGKRSPGWAWTGGKDFSAMMYVSDFWQTFPNELEAQGGKSLTYHFWPAHGVSMPDRKIVDANRQYLWYCHEGKILDFKVPEVYYTSPAKDKKEEYKLRYVRNGRYENCMGVAKSAEIFIDFNIPEKDCGKMAALWQNSPLVMATPEWMCASGVFGRILAASPEKFPEEEKALSKLFDCERRLQDHTKDYGKFNYGDSHTGWNYSTRRWDDAYRCWRGYHHCSGTVPWILYIRSGDPKYLRWGVVSARHLMDIDMCNWTTPEYEKLEYPHGKIKGGLCDYKGLSHWHSGNRLMDYNSMTNFMIYYYYLTGDRKGLDTAEMWGRSVKEKFRKPSDGRSAAGTSSALMDLYMATGDKEYFDIAEKYVRNTLENQNINNDKTFCHHTLAYFNAKGKIIPKGAFSGGGGWENYAPWLEKYYDITGDKEIAERIVLWANAYIDGYGDTSSIWRVMGDNINIMGYAYFITKDPKYLEYGMFFLTYYLNGIVDKPGDLFDGFGTIGAVSLGFDYMSLRIPVFLAALNDYGKPVKIRFIEKGLSAVLSRPTEIFVQNNDGKSFTVQGGLCNEKGMPPAHLKISGPSGETIMEKEIKGEGYIPFRITLSDGNTGVYKFVFNDVKIQLLDFSVSHGLRWVQLWNNNPGQRAGGRRLFFRLPEKIAELTITREPTFMNTSSTLAELVGPDGSSKGIISKGILKVKVSPEDAGKEWSIRGTFGKKNEFSIMVDGKKIASYLATGPGLYFNPDEFPKAASNGKGVKKAELVEALFGDPAKEKNGK